MVKKDFYEFLKLGEVIVNREVTSTGSGEHLVCARAKRPLALYPHMDQRETNWDWCRNVSSKSVSPLWE